LSGGIKMPISPKITKNVAIPQGVKATLKGNTLAILGPKGTLKRTFTHPRISIKVKKDKITIETLMPKRKENALAGTWAAHIGNMVRGVTVGFKFTMKVVYSHFPVKTILKDNQFVIENFLGESYPRSANILGDTKVEIKGDTISLSGINLEDVSQSSANIELATKITNYDPRVFQDGIYLIEKGVMDEGGE
jgi:large subunit ribosomal protein L6